MVMRPTSHRSQYFRREGKSELSHEETRVARVVASTCQPSYLQKNRKRNSEQRRAPPTMALSSSTMRLLCFLILLLLQHNISAFTVSSRTATRVSLFGGKQAAVSSQNVSWKHQASLKDASRIMCISDGRIALSAYRKIREEHQKRNIASRVKRWVSSFRKVTTTFLVAAFFAFSCFVNSASAVSGGRMGGSFSPSNSRSSGGGGGSSIHRSSPRGYSSPRMRGYNSPGIRIYAPQYRMGPSYFPPSPRLFHSSTSDAPVRRFGVGDMVVLGGTGYVLYSAFAKPKRGGSSTPLGPGASVASITLALEVPDRDNFYSILNKLKRLAQSADTSTREGVQTLVSNGMYVAVNDVSW